MFVTTRGVDSLYNWHKCFKAKRYLYRCRFTHWNLQHGFVAGIGGVVFLKVLERYSV